MIEIKITVKSVRQNTLIRIIALTNTIGLRRPPPFFLFVSNCPRFQASVALIFKRHIFVYYSVVFGYIMISI